MGNMYCFSSWEKVCGKYLYMNNSQNISIFVSYWFKLKFVYFLPTINIEVQAISNVDTVYEW